MEHLVIAIDGMDCVGKETLKNGLLQTYLNEFHAISFPRYETATGRVIRNYLDTLSDDVVDRDIPVHERYKNLLYYTMDRLDFFSTNEYPLLLCDRYYTANMLYQPLSMNSKEERLEFAKKIEKIETESLGIPKADLVIILRNNPDIISKMVEERGNVTDGFESHKTQTKLFKHIEDLQEYYTNWIIIDVNKNNNTMYTPAEILEKVVKVIDKRLGDKITNFKFEGEF